MLVDVNGDSPVLSRAHKRGKYRVARIAGIKRTGRQFVQRRNQTMIGIGVSGCRLHRNNRLKIGEPFSVLLHFTAPEFCRSRSSMDCPRAPIGSGHFDLEAPYDLGNSSLELGLRQPRRVQLDMAIAGTLKTLDRADIDAFQQQYLDVLPKVGRLRQATSEKRVLPVSDHPDVDHGVWAGTLKTLVAFRSHRTALCGVFERAKCERY